MLCQFRVLQVGSLPLAPDGTFDLAVEHRCTSTLVWPAGEKPAPENSVIADQCFTYEGYEGARAELKRLGISFSEVGRPFVTHLHYDHGPAFPLPEPWPLAFDPDALQAPPPLPGLDLVPCPGHSPDLIALRFRGPDGRRIWIAGDAVLDERWLRAWRYYWPNEYSVAEVIRTWASLGAILERADLVIPGHGPPIAVTAELVECLLAGFDRADRAAGCAEVKRALEERLAGLRERGAGEGLA